MDNASKNYSSFAVFTGIRKGQCLESQTLIGTATRTTTDGVYRLVLNRPYAKFYYMVQSYLDNVKYNVFCPEAEGMESTFKPCGEAKLNPDFQSYLELNVKGYPPLFMDLYPIKEAA